MAFKHGKSTAVYFNGLDLSGYLTDAGIAIDVDTAETTTFGSSWKSFLAGTEGTKADFSGLYDPTLTALSGSIGTDFGLTTGVLTYCPSGGSAIGDRARLMSVSTTAYAESSPVGGIVAVKWAAMTSAALGVGDVLHPLGEDTNTTTGAEKDDTSATTTGWTAHLHVIAVDAGSWVVKLQDAAVSNTYSDVTGGAFTAATGVTQQRLQGAAGSTLRRYVRYVATRTGGAGGDGITFMLAYARNN
jgi:hypothetical protein